METNNNSTFGRHSKDVDQGMLIYQRNNAGNVFSMALF